MMSVCLFVSVYSSWRVPYSAAHKRSLEACYLKKLVHELSGFLPDAVHNKKFNNKH